MKRSPLQRLTFFPFLFRTPTSKLDQTFNRPGTNSFLFLSERSSCLAISLIQALMSWTKWTRRGRDWEKKRQAVERSERTLTACLHFSRLYLLFVHFVQRAPAEEKLHQKCRLRTQVSFSLSFERKYETPERAYIIWCTFPSHTVLPSFLIFDGKERENRWERSWESSPPRILSQPSLLFPFVFQKKTKEVEDKTLGTRSLMGGHLSTSLPSLLRRTPSSDNLLFDWRLRTRGGSPRREGTRPRIRPHHSYLLHAPDL